MEDNEVGLLFRSKKTKSQKKILLYPGSFNPIHYGHLMVAKKAWVSDKFFKLYFLLTPQNPFKESNVLLPYDVRYHLLRIALRNKKFSHRQRRWFPSNVEQKIMRQKMATLNDGQIKLISNSTVQTIKWLKEKNPHLAYSLLIGEDNLCDLEKWHDYHWLLDEKNVEFLVCPRKSALRYPARYRRYLLPLGVDNTWEKKIDWQNISSTNIRNELQKTVGNGIQATRLNVLLEQITLPSIRTLKKYYDNL